MAHDFKPKDCPPLKPVVHQCVLNAPNGLETHDIAPLAGYEGSRITSYTNMMTELKQEGRKCDLNRLLPIMNATDSDAPLHFLARHRNGIFYRLPEPATGPGTLVESLAATIKEFGEFASEAAQCINKGTITAGMMERMDKEGYEAIGAIMAMLNLARATLESKARW